MAYYLIITTCIDYEWDVDNKFACIGFPARNRKSVSAMTKGDKIAFYVTGESKFMATAEVTGGYFYSESRIWDDEFELYPHRIHSKPCFYIQNIEDGIYIKDIWDDLEFITNHHKWGSCVQGSLRKLSQHDFEVIEKNIKRKGK